MVVKEAQFLHEDLENAIDRGIILITDLHALFLIIQVSIFAELAQLISSKQEQEARGFISWGGYMKVLDRIPVNDKRVALHIGIDVRFIRDQTMSGNHPEV